MSALEPGIYRATVRGVPDVTVMVTDATYDYGVTQTPCPVVRGEHQHARIDITDARPLIVIDLDDPAEVVAALRKADLGWSGRRRNLDDIARQIEAQTKPARIPEPGLWGVVEARVNAGVVTARVEWVRRAGSWHCPEHGFAQWDVLLDPTLIRDGVTS